MYERSQVPARKLASVTGERKKGRALALKTERTLQLLVADLVAARTAAGMTQEAVAARMWTTKSVVSRLESGVCTRPTLSTIEKYAVAVHALVEIRVRTRRELVARALKPDARSYVRVVLRPSTIMRK
jgi:ribosome-binding protein aMBF1 (putative translation factor)